MPEITASSESKTSVQDALNKVEAVEMTPDGERPLSSEEKAQASTAASPEGAPAEKAVSQPEGAPVKESSSRVEVVTAPTPQKAPTEVAPTAEAPKEEPKEDNMVDALKKLEAWSTERTEVVRRAAQSTADKSNAQFTRQMEESNARAETLQREMRELSLRELTEEEKVRARETYAQEDRSVELDAKAIHVEDLAKATIIDSLLFEYKDYGVDRNELEAMGNAEEMELHCSHVQTEFLMKKLSEQGEKKEEPAAPKAEEPPKEQPKPAQPVANVPEVPAGVQAPSDVGTSGTPPVETKFSEEQGVDHLRDNLRNARWETVRIR